MVDRVVDTPNHQLDLGIGAGYRDSDRADGTSDANAIGRGSLAYNWVWTETSGFTQDLTVESGSDNTYIESVSAVRARLIGDFNLVLSYTIKQNSDVPVGTDKTDTHICRLDRIRLLAISRKNIARSATRDGGRSARRFTVLVGRSPRRLAGASR